MPHGTASPDATVPVTRGDPSRAGLDPDPVGVLAGPSGVASVGWVTLGIRGSAPSSAHPTGRRRPAARRRGQPAPHHETRASSSRSSPWTASGCSIGTKWLARSST